VGGAKCNIIVVMMNLSTSAESHATRAFQRVSRFAISRLSWGF
jgi:hypothetical protein